MRSSPAVALVLVLAGTAGAAPSAGKDAKLAHQKLAAAQDAERKGDADAAHGRNADARTQWTAAEAAYQQAIDASDDVAINVALAGVEDKLGHVADAYKHLQLVVHANVKSDAIKKAQDKLDDLSAKVGTVKLTIVPDGAQIEIAGNLVGTSPLGEPLLLAPGKYTATITAQGYQPKDIELKLQAGSEIDKKVALEPVPIAVSTTVHDAPPPPAPAPKPSYLPLIIGGGVTLGFTVAATLTGIAAIHQHSIYVDPTTAETDRTHAQSTGRLEAHVTDACIVGAIAAAAVTAGWYYFKSNGTESAKVGVAPWVQSDVGGLVAAGSF
jgi:PEGA domain